MRWLLVKDLQILRRSPLLVSLLVIYPVLISLLIGLALSRSPDKPKVAFFNEVPAGQGTVAFGNESVDVSKYADQFFNAVDPVQVSSRDEAIQAVKDGRALAALIVPADVVAKLQSGVQPAQVEVIYNGDALKQNLVESTISSQLARANQALANKVTEVAIRDLNLLFLGGKIETPLGSFDLLGLRNAKPRIDAAVRRLPPGSPERAELVRVSRFASLASQGLGLAKAGLSTVAQPVDVKRTVISGKSSALDAFAVVLAVTVSLMFVCVLLAAGVLALEREENAYGRLVRGLVSRTALLGEKVLLAAACSFAVGLLMLVGIGAFTGVDFGRFARWLPALALGAVAFAALGVAIGALAREVRAASLLAFLLSLPIAFVALVPSGAVSGAVYGAVRVVNAVFPFRPTLEALDSAVNGAGSGLLGPCLHLAALTLVFGALARLALRRF